MSTSTDTDSPPQRSIEQRSANWFGHVTGPVDTDLIRRVAQRDRAAFEALYDRYASAGLGLASVLTTIGILFVHAGRLFGRIPLGGRLVQALPVVSALFITAAGLFITFEALIQAGVLRT